VSDGHGRAGLGLVGASIGLFGTVALLGPSAEEPGPAGSGPPFALSVHPAAGLVVGLVAAGIVLGAAGAGLCLYAMRTGWRCSARALLIAGLLVTVAFALMPPVGSADHLNYAAYGRMTVLGHDPYVSHADQFRHDPVIGAVQEWTGTPSVYGPIVTAQQALASWIGGTSVRLTVFALSVTNALAFAAVGLLLHFRTKDPLRAAVLWTLNPLLLFHLVSGAHNDAIGVAAAVAGLTLLTTGRASAGRMLAAGTLTGAAFSIKYPAALVGGGLVWESRRRVSYLVALFGGAGAVALAAFALGGFHAVRTVRGASKMVSLSSPWHLVDRAVPHQRTLIQAGVVVMMLGLLWVLLRGLPGRSAMRSPGRPAPSDSARSGALGLGRAEVSDTSGTSGPGGAEPAEGGRSERPEPAEGGRSERPEPSGSVGPVGFAASVGSGGDGRSGDAAVRVAAALVLAWLFATQYSLPWYDGLGWAMLAMIVSSGVDWVLLAHTTVMSLAYLPARRADVIGMPHDLLFLEHTVRPDVVPIVLAGVVVALVVVCLRGARSAGGWSFARGGVSSAGDGVSSAGRMQ
jgi:hypothetical protein